jgi:hypothetical protein
MARVRSAWRVARGAWRVAELCPAESIAVDIRTSFPTLAGTLRALAASV